MPTPRLKFPPGAQFASVAAACLEHGCMSTRSFADAAMTLGLIGSTASIGSFCPFRGNELAGLATLTRAPVALADTAAPVAWAAGNPADSAHTMLPAATSTSNRLLLCAFIVS